MKSVDAKKSVGTVIAPSLNFLFTMVTGRVTAIPTSTTTSEAIAHPSVASSSSACSPATWSDFSSKFWPDIALEGRGQM
jgi:hypothetical protein